MVLLENGFFVLASLAILQGLRLILGWRLVTAETANPELKGQYRLLDLLEWTTTIALCLGSVVWLDLLIVESGRRNGLSFLGCIQPVVQLALLGAPIVLAILSDRLSATGKAASLVTWSALIIGVLFLFDQRHRSITLRDLLAMAPRGWAPHLVAYLASIVGNSLVLRVIGLRWLR
jgi:hypothetical protein